MTRAQRWVGPLLFAIVLAGGCESPGSGKPQPNAQERAQVDAVAKQIREFGVKAEEGRRLALSAALRAPMPEPSGPCPIKVPVPASEHPLGGGEGDLPPDWRDMRADQMTLVSPEQARTADGKRWTTLQDSVKFWQQDGRFSEWMTDYAGPKGWRWELTVVADERREPKAVSKEEFQSGLVVGRAFLYSFADERIVCAGPVKAQSSELLRTSGVRMPSGTDFNLAFDLENEAYRAAARSLGAVTYRAEPAGAAASASASARAVGSASSPRQ